MRGAECANRCRWWWFRVSTLILATTLLASVLGWWIEHQRTEALRRELALHDALIDALVRESEDDARKATQSLRVRNKGASAVPILLSALRTANSDFSYRVALILGHDVGPDVRAAVPTLIEWLDDDQVTIRDHSFLVLRVAALDSPDVQRAFLAALKHDNSDVRHSAVFNLSVLDWRKLPGARSTLAELLKDKDPKVREQARSTLDFEKSLEFLENRRSGQ